MLRSVTLRTVGVNTAIIGIGLANSILLSRLMGPEGRGALAAAMLWPTLLIYLSSMGMMSSVLYFAALPESRTEFIFANGVALAVVQSIVGSTVGYIALPWLLASQTSETVGASRIYLFVIPASLFTQYGMSILQGRLKLAAFNQLRLIVPVGYLLGVLILYASVNLTVVNIIFLHLLLNILGVFATLAVLLILRIKLGLRTDLGLAKGMLKYGVQVQIGDVSQTANLRLDQALMAGLLPSAHLGLYVVAVSTASVSQVLSTAVRMVVTPRIANEVSEAGRKKVLEEAFRKYWLASICMALIVGGCLPFAIPLFFGAEFSAAITPAIVLLVGTLLIGAKDVLAGGAQSLGNPWLGSRAELYSLVVTVVMLSVLLPTLGILGAAIATAIAYAAQLVVLVHGLNRTYSITPVQLFSVERSDVRTLYSSLAKQFAGQAKI